MTRLTAHLRFAESGVASQPFGSCSAPDTSAQYEALGVRRKAAEWEAGISRLGGDIRRMVAKRGKFVAAYLLPPYRKGWILPARSLVTRMGTEKPSVNAGDAQQKRASEAYSSPLNEPRNDKDRICRSRATVDPAGSR
jgi:hypothetical protein